MTFSVGGRLQLKPLERATSRPGDSEMRQARKKGKCGRLEKNEMRQARKKRNATGSKKRKCGRLESKKQERISRGEDGAACPAQLTNGWIGFGFGLFSAAVGLDSLSPFQAFQCCLPPAVSASQSHASPPIGSDRIGSDRIGSDRIGSDRIGSARIG